MADAPWPAAAGPLGGWQLRLQAHPTLNGAAYLDTADKAFSSTVLVQEGSLSVQRPPGREGARLQLQPPYHQALRSAPDPGTAGAPAAAQAATTILLAARVQAPSVQARAVVPGVLPHALSRGSCSREDCRQQAWLSSAGVWQATCVQPIWQASGPAPGARAVCFAGVSPPLTRRGHYPGLGHPPAAHLPGEAGSAQRLPSDQPAASAPGARWVAPGSPPAAQSARQRLHTARRDQGAGALLLTCPCQLGGRGERVAPGAAAP